MALEHPTVVKNYLRQELLQKAVLGPFAQQDIKHLEIHVSEFGIIPKKHIPGKWRLIVDLAIVPGEA